MIKKGRVHGFPHARIPAKREANIGDASTDVGTGQIFTDPPCRFEEINGIASMLIHSRGHRENIGVEDDVFRRESNMFGEQRIGAVANFNPTLIIVGLPLFVKRHDDGCGTISPN